MTQPLVYDARALHTGHAGRGIGRVVREVVGGLARLGIDAEVAGPAPPPPLRHRRHAARMVGGALTPGRLQGSPVVRLAPTWPSAADASSVVCCYDLIPLKAMGEHFPAHRVLRRPLDFAGYHASLDTLRRARGVWTISAAVAEDVVTLLGVSPERVRPIPLTVAPSFGRPPPNAVAATAARWSLPSEHLLWVLGGTNANKNVRGMLEVTAAAPDLPPLVVVGRFRPEIWAKVLRLAQRVGAPTPRWLADVDDADLPALLHGASAVVVPSLDEGFGLPLLEGIVAGARVAASDIPVLREVGGEDAVYGDARSSGAFADAVRRAMDAPRPPVRSRRSWTDVARDVHAFAEEALGVR